MFQNEPYNKGLSIHHHKLRRVPKWALQEGIWVFISQDGFWDGLSNACPFQGLTMDVIRKILPTSRAAKHTWILKVTNNFTKWVEAKSYAELSAKEVYDFVEEHIVSQFDILETIITDNGIVFKAERFKQYISGLKIISESQHRIIPKSMNKPKSVTKLLSASWKKMLKEKPSMWHLNRNEALWPKLAS